MSTTADSIRQQDDAWREDRLNREVAGFAERWAPEDRQEAAMFHAQLHSVVRAVYADMQTPVTKCLEHVLRVATSPVFVMNSQKDKL